MEDTAKGSKKTIVILPSKGIDASLLQQAVDAMQGRPIRSRPSSTMPDSFPPISPLFIPGGRGGSTPGGGGGRPGGRGSSSLSPGGPDFFAQPVTDDLR